MLAYDYEKYIYIYRAKKRECEQVCVCVFAYCETCDLSDKSMVYLYFIDLGSRLYIRIFPKVQLFGYVVLEADFHTYRL